MRRLLDKMVFVAMRLFSHFRGTTCLSSLSQAAGFVAAAACLKKGDCRKFIAFPQARHALARMKIKKRHAGLNHATSSTDKVNAEAHNEMKQGKCNSGTFWHLLQRATTLLGLSWDRSTCSRSYPLVASFQVLIPSEVVQQSTLLKHSLNCLLFSKKLIVLS